MRRSVVGRKPVIFLLACAGSACGDLTAEPQIADSDLSQSAELSYELDKASECLADTDTTRRTECLSEAGLAEFDATPMAKTLGCIPFCICGVQENCPCCEWGPYGPIVVAPNRSPLDPYLPSEPLRESIAIELEELCTEKSPEGAVVAQLRAETDSRLAPFVDLKISRGRAGLVQAQLTNSGPESSEFDRKTDDDVWSGRAELDGAEDARCETLGCHFGCEGEWVYPEPSEGHCPAHDWWGIGCLKLTSCSFGCGSDSDTVVEPLESIYTLKPESVAPTRQR